MRTSPGTVEQTFESATSSCVLDTIAASCRNAVRCIADNLRPLSGDAVSLIAECRSVLVRLAANVLSPVEIAVHEQLTSLDGMIAAYSGPVDTPLASSVLRRSAVVCVTSAEPLGRPPTSFDAQALCWVSLPHLKQMWVSSAALWSYDPESAPARFADLFASGIADRDAALERVRRNWTAKLEHTVCQRQAPYFAVIARRPRNYNLDAEATALRSLAPGVFDRAVVTLPEVVVQACTLLNDGGSVMFAHRLPAGIDPAELWKVMTSLGDDVSYRTCFDAACGVLRAVAS